MTIIIRQLRAVFTEAATPSLRQKKQTEKQQRRKSLSVKISKEPPNIVYYERHDLEDSFECIFDPLVSHDEEKDHPDLFQKKATPTDGLKPWQKAPYCSSSNKSTFMSKFKLTFNKPHNILMHQSNQSAGLVV